MKQFKPKSEFSRNALTLMSGTTIAQAIPIVISPILTRIYTPEDFGIFGLYIAIVSVLSASTTGKYELAIMLPKRDKDALNIASFSIIMTLMVSLLFAFIVYIYNTDISSLLHNPNISLWLYFLPISLFLSGIYQILFFWNNRKKEYKLLANSTILQSSSIGITNLALSLLHFLNGLILGNVLGQIITNILFWKKSFQKNNYSYPISKLRMLANIRKYYNFPLYSMPMSILNSMSSNIIIYSLSIFFNPLLLGYYYLSQRVLNTPLTIISSSLSSFFFQSVAHLERKKHLYLKTFTYSLLVNTALVTPLFLFGAEIFSFIFGSQWQRAGEIAQILSPLLILSSATGSVSTIFPTLLKNEITLIWQIIYFGGFLFVIYFYHSNFDTMLQLTTIFGSLMYFTLFVIGYTLVKGSYVKKDR
jgi:O-antigen/teichoic acid export membrane protein